jgi:MoaA/NifB/PqqE/SkfB family radical SAM enzyme
MEELAEKYKDQGVEFLLVYIIEPHPEEKGYERIVQPATDEERARLARETIRECKIRRKTVIDTMDNDFYMAYGGCPNMVYVINPDGMIVYHDRWASHVHVGEFLAAIAD